MIYDNVFLYREPNVWPVENDLGLDGRRFKATFSKSFKLRMNLSRKLVEEIAIGLEYPEFVEKFKKAEVSGWNLKKYSERNDR